MSMLIVNVLSANSIKTKTKLHMYSMRIAPPLCEPQQVRRGNDDRDKHPTHIELSKEYEENIYTYIS